jgi:hypothetical protein
MSISDNGQLINMTEVFTALEHSQQGNVICRVGSAVVDLMGPRPLWLTVMFPEELGERPQSDSESLLYHQRLSSFLTFVSSVFSYAR